MDLKKKDHFFLLLFLMFCEKRVGYYMKFGLLFLMVVVCSGSVFALGISPIIDDFDYNSNLTEKDIPFFLFGANNLDDILISVTGDFENYVNVTTDFENPENIFYPFNVHLTFPKDLDPGPHDLWVSLSEANEGGQLNFAVLIKHKITIFYPYQGSYLHINSILVDNPSVGDLTTTLRISLENYGNEEINQGTIDFFILDQESKIIKTLNINSISLKSREKKLIEQEISVEGLMKGVYNLSANFNFEKQDKDALNTSFRIGTYFVDIINATTKLESGKVNLFEIKLNSDWNGLIEDIYADVKFGDQNIKSTTVQIKPFEEKVITAYIDATNIGVGQLLVPITLHYGDKTTEKEFLVEVVSEDTGINYKRYLLPVSIGIGVIILILINVIVLLKLRKRRNY